MPQVNKLGHPAQRAAEIIRDAGGRVVGRTRLQKIAYLLELSGVGTGFHFEYRHYGPYCEDLTSAIRSANRLGIAKEEEHPTSWGGFYSIFTTELASSGEALPGRIELVQKAASADPIELELAATAAFLFSVGEVDPWGETERRKPEKAKDRLERAKTLYASLRRIHTPLPLPDLS
ncbi:hypothetical protein [Methylosinus sp. LW4]|uniref:hypothetical protein n=1 Tax=Methylosinus sp. LW4 TaxID=136993 RepID=UPI0012FB6A48|nr:hypothetical protein [Methylosinus sp. LW4]